jgi:hypothetical protein
MIFDSVPVLVVGAENLTIKLGFFSFQAFKGI